MLRQNSLEIINNQQDIKIYTDGSKIQNLCDIGIYIEITPKEIITIATTKKKLKHCTIYTDSKASCMILETAIDELYVDEFINRILFNLELTQCKIQWIPRHVGINGNEKDDKLAKEGTKQQSIIKNRR